VGKKRLFIFRSIRGHLPNSGNIALMSIRDDFKPYTDANNLLAPNVVPPNSTGGASDNGPMFTSEYFVMLKKHGYLTQDDVADYAKRIGACINSEGMLCRVPVGQDDGQEQVDDYYAVNNGCMELGITSIPRGFLKAMLKYFGCLNNENPGKWTGNSFLARQPQLVCAMVSAAFPSMKNPLHYLARLVAFPLYLVSALVILTSCIGTPTSDTDARRLAWHLGNNVSKVSLMNWLAYKVWKNRLYRDYSAPAGMPGVAAIYYQPQGTNPYSNWWVT
jgi:hypothetical protein